MRLSEMNLFEGTTLTCDNCGEEFGKDTENCKVVRCGVCGDIFENPHGYTCGNEAKLRAEAKGESSSATWKVTETGYKSPMGSYWHVVHQTRGKESRTIGCYGTVEPQSSMQRPYIKACLWNAEAKKPDCSVTEKFKDDGSPINGTMGLIQWMQAQYEAGK